MSTTLRKVSPILLDHTRGAEMVGMLARFARSYDTETVDWAIAEAVYWIGADYHTGQACPLYSAMCATGFRPSPLAKGPSDDLSRSIYNYLASILER